MSADLKKSDGFRTAAHFITSWGAGEAIVALLGSIGTLVWAADNQPKDWLSFGVGLSALFVYWNIAILTRPEDVDQREADDK